MTRTEQQPALSAATFHILLALAEGEIHGYAISKEVEGATGGAVVLNPATLYRTLRQLLVDGWIVEGPADPEDSRRRAYRLTPRGRRVAQTEAQRLVNVIRMARERRLLPAFG